MAQQPLLQDTKIVDGRYGHVASAAGPNEGRRLTIVHSRSDPIATRLQSCKYEEKAEELSHESHDIVVNPDFYAPTRRNNAPASRAARTSSSTSESSPSDSRPNSPFTIPSQRSLPSTATSVNVLGADQITDTKTRERRPSVLSRFRSSISTFSAVSSVNRRRSVSPSDFRDAPEIPEKHFIDSVGMVIPGVCDRNRCSHPLTHFVISCRLSEPIEYTTVLADHGITYSDYCRLLAALAGFLDELPNEPKPKQKKGAASGSRGLNAQQEQPIDYSGVNLLEREISQNRSSRRTSSESLECFKKSEEQAANLNNLLAEITLNLRIRRLPVMVCIGSYSLFAPHRISEAQVQILHVALESKTPPEVMPDYDLGQCMSFADSFSGSVRTYEPDDCTVAFSRRVLSERSGWPPSPASPVLGPIFHHHQLHLRDRTRPWPLWPNAIPTPKRGLMESQADRYGIDPYFRAYMRANVNSRTTSTSYAKYMIETEDNPFINTRLEYTDSPSNTGLMWNRLTRGTNNSKPGARFATNRERYEHNYKLECRKTVEHGSRLRLLRFGFRHPLYPPHTPEMCELGLGRAKYDKVISDIEDIRRNARAKESTPYLMPGFAVKALRRRSAEEALTKVSEYVRKLNAQQGKIIWTIEKIPGCYENHFGNHINEWEISAWNGEDPLELLLQLEKWGIIEKRLDIDDDE